MTKPFKDIEGIDPLALELLDAAGYADTGSITGKGIAEITEELIKANSILEIVAEQPTADTVKEWLEPIEEVVGSLDIKKQIVRQEYIIEPGELLATSYATPLSQSFIDKHEVDFSSLPMGKARFTSEEDASEHAFTLLDGSHVGGKKPVPLSPDENEDEEEAKDEISDTSGIGELDDLGELEPLPELEKTIAQTVKSSVSEKEELEKTIRQTVSTKDSTEEEIDPAERAIKESEDRLADVDEIFSDAVFSSTNSSIQKEKILSMDAFREKGSHISPLQNASSSNITKSVKKETNAGVDPSSRRYIRGVLHTDKETFRVSSVAFILFNLCMLAGIVLTPLVLVDKEKYSWAVWSPLLFVLGIFIYLTLARKAGCPICNQKQYRPKACLKHKNAHHMPILGYMLPTALHALIFKWFRCIFCGTSVRLKE